MNFDEIFKIMDEAFPDSEMRAYECQKRLLQNEKYHIYEELDDGRLVGFLAYWTLNGCVFFEHLAVSSACRGQGIGKNILLKNIKDIKLPIFLEVEPPETDIAKRRIAFYERLGFCLNDFYYEQPPLRKNQTVQQLLIMSYPAPISTEEFAKYKKEIYTNVYKTPL